MASDSQANFDFLNHRITTDPRPEDPGPEWLVWARQLRINHNELLHHMQQISEATARLTEATAHNAEATARHSEAIARIEEQIREQRFSHSELHDKANVIQEDVRRLSDIFDKIETHCDVEINDTWRRISIVEKQQEALLHTVRRCSSRIERSAVDTHNNDSPHGLVTDAASARSSPQNSTAGHHNSHSQSSISRDGVTQSSGPMNEIQAALPRNVPPHIRQLSDKTRAYEPEPAQRDDRWPQGMYELDEYIILRGDTIETRLRDFERKLINDFINDMNDADQRTMLVERLNQTAWTWKTAKQEAAAICQAEREPQGIGGLARRWAAGSAGMAEAEQEAEGEDEAEHEARQPAPKPRVQKKTRRRRKNW